MRSQQHSLNPAAIVYFAASLLTCSLSWIAIRSSPEPLVASRVERLPQRLRDVGTRDGSPPTDEPQDSPPCVPKLPSPTPNLDQAARPLGEPESCPDWRTTEAYRQGYRDGVREADLQFKGGRVTIYVYGMRGTSDGVVRETGLPLETIAGCYVDPWIVARAAGHNDRVMELLEVHGDPPNSFKKWEKELFDLAGFVRARSKTTEPLRIKAGGPPVVSPDGEVTIRPMSVSHQFERGFLGLGVEAKGRTLGSVNVGAFAYEGVELFWGPERSGFAVIRLEWGGAFRLQAFSLSDGARLREEWVRKRDQWSTTGESRSG